MNASSKQKLRAPKGSFSELEKSLVNFLLRHKRLSKAHSKELGLYIVDCMLGRGGKLNPKFKDVAISNDKSLKPTSVNRALSRLRGAIKDSDINNWTEVKKLSKASLVALELLEKDSKALGIKKSSKAYKNSLRALSDLSSYNPNHEHIYFYYLHNAIESLGELEMSASAKELQDALSPLYVSYKSRAYNHPILETLILPDKELLGLKSESLDSRNAKRSVNRFYFDPSQFLGWSEVVLSSRDSSVEELMLAVAIATGRRMYAIGHLSDFACIKRPSGHACRVEDNWMRQRYIPKKSLLKKDSEVAFISVLDSALVLKGLKRIRKLAKGQTWNVGDNIEFNNRLSYRFKPVIEKHFPEHVDSFTFKRTRDMYARIVTDRYNNTEHSTEMTDSMFIMSMCAHESELTSATYEATSFVPEESRKDLQYWKGFYSSKKQSENARPVELQSKAYKAIDSFVVELDRRRKELNLQINKYEILDIDRLKIMARCLKIILKDSSDSEVVAVNKVVTTAQENSLKLSKQKALELVDSFPETFTESYELKSGRVAKNKRFNFSKLL